MKKYHQQLLTTLVLSSILGMGLYAQPALAGSTEVVTRVTDKENDISGQTNISTNVYGGDLSLDADSIAALLDNTDVSVKNNKVIGENSAFTISRNKGIYGGYLKAEGTADGSPTVTFTVSGNSVSFSDSTFTGKNNLVAGGYGEISLGDAASVVLSPINVTDNAVNISFENEKLAEETTFNADLYGGYTDLGNANSNEVTITGVKAADGSNLLTLDADVFGGKSGGADSSRVFHGGSADDNTVNLKNVTLNGDVQGGYVKYGLAGISSASGNEVTIEASKVASDSTTSLYGGSLWIDSRNVTTAANADGTTTVSYTDKNSKNITYTLPAAANLGANKNVITLKDLEHTLTDADLYVYGGDAEYVKGTSSLLTANDNQVNISSTLNEAAGYRDVYGGKVEMGNADGNSVTITGQKLEGAEPSNIIVSQVFGGYAKGSGNILSNAENNKVSLENVTLLSHRNYSSGAPSNIAGGYVYNGFAGLSGASKNEVAITDSVILATSSVYSYSELYGGYLQVYGVPSAVTTTESTDGTTTVSYEIDGNTYTLPGALSAGANENTITLTNLKKNGSRVTADVYGGYAIHGDATVYSPLTANKNRVTISSTLDTATEYEEVYGGYVDEGNADGNSVKITGKLLAMPDEDGNSFNTIVGSVIGGKTSNPIEFYGNAEHNNVTLENVQAGSVYGGNVYGLSGNGASSNTVTLIDSLVSKTYNVYATVADGAVYGGYLGLHLYHLDDEKPTIQADTAAKTATVDDSYITADAEKAGANSNIVNVSYSLDASTAYERVIGGYTEAGSANANQVTVSGKQLTQGTNLTIGAEPDADDRDAGYYPAPVIYIAAAGGIAACGTANENTLTLTNTSLQNDVYGGLVGSTQGGTFSFYGDYYMPNDLFTADATEANTNRVFLTDASSTGVIYGGYVVPDEGTAIAEAQANENTVQMVQTLDKETSYGDVLGGTALYGEANGNKVILQSTEKGSITATSVIGGGTGGTSADNNTVALTNSKAIGSIIGGTTVLPAQKSIYDYDEDSEGYVHFHITKTYTSALSFTAAAEQSAQGNTVSLAKVNASGLVLGGMVMQGTAAGNTVTLTNGSAAADVYGGISGVGAAQGNTVTISGSTAGSVYGGAAGLLGTDAGSLRSTLINSMPTVDYTSIKEYESYDDGWSYTYQGTTLTDVAYTPTVTGSVSSASGNTVNLVSGTVDAIYGGYAVDSTMDANVAAPTVQLKYSFNEDDWVWVAEAVDSSDASDAEISVMTAEAAEPTSTTYKSGAANDNTVNVYAGTVNNGITGGYSQSSTANNNTVNFYGGTVTKGIIGGQSESGTANNNTVNFANGTAASGIVSGKSETGTANGNTVNFYSGTTNANIVGGQAESEANNNTVNFSGGTVANGIIGGQSDSSTANGNTVNFYSGTTNTNIVGGQAKSEANNNTVNVFGGTVAEGVIGGQSDSGTANDNTINFYGGTVTEGLLGGQSTTGAAKDNTVNLYAALLTSEGKLYGGQGTESTGNTLNVYAKGSSVKNLDYFQNMNFYVPAGTGAGETLLTVTGTANAKDSNIQAAVGNATYLADGEVINLLADANGVETNQGTSYSMKEGMDTALNAGFLRRKVSIWKQDDNTVVLGVLPGTPGVLDADTKVLSEGQTNAANLVAGGSEVAVTDGLSAAMEAWQGQYEMDRMRAYINQGGLETSLLVKKTAPSELLSQVRTDSLTVSPAAPETAAETAAKTAPTSAAETAPETIPAPAANAAFLEQQDVAAEYVPYVMLGGHNLRYNTTSTVDTNGFNGELGFIKRTFTDGYSDTIMPFIEYGTGNFTSWSGSARGDGSQHYVGAGLLLRRDLNNGVHYEGLVRGGHLSGEYAGRIAGVDASYNTASNYFAAHAGLGKVYKQATNDFDIYGKLFYSHLGSDDFQLHSAFGAADYKLDGVNSIRTRLGFRWTKHLDEKTSSVYAGLGWDREFDGESTSHYQDYTSPDASMKGSSEFLELGWKSSATKTNPWGADLRVTGWHGVKQGFTYSATIFRKM